MKQRRNNLAEGGAAGSFPEHAAAVGSSRFPTKESFVSPKHTPFFVFFALLMLGVLRIIYQAATAAEDSTIAVSMPAFLAGALPLRPTKLPYSSKVHKCERKDLQDLRKQNLLLSQKAEDEMLLSFFNGLCGGTYMEMGALNGLSFSNSYVFNKAFGWKGLMVELVPSNYEKLVVNRPNEIATINAAVCSEPKVLHFYEKKGLGAVNGVWEFAAPDFRKRAWPNATLADTTEIQCRRLQDIIDEVMGESTEAGVYFDFFSLDIEGAEIEALLSIDFDRVNFGVLVIEGQRFNPRKDYAVISILENHGYFFLENTKHNDWLMNKEFYRLYQEFLMDE